MEKRLETPISKRSQTTIFIIIAIIVIATILLLIFLRFNSEKEELSREEFLSQGLEPSINNIQSFIIDCLEETSLDALELIGIQGGYHKKPQLFYDLQWAFIPYYYHQGQYLQPTNREVENQLSSYINEALEFCIDEIKFRNFRITYSQPTTQSSIQKNKVTLTTTLSTSIEHDGSTTNFQLDNHPVTINSTLFDMLEVATYITQSHQEDKDFICINCLTQLTKEKNLFVDFIAFEPDSTLIMLLENSTQPEPYIFQFLNKYELPQE